MKKIISVLLVILTVCGCFNFAAFAARTEPLDHKNEGYVAGHGNAKVKTIAVFYHNKDFGDKKDDATCFIYYSKNKQDINSVEEFNEAVSNGKIEFKCEVEPDDIVIGSGYASDYSEETVNAIKITVYDYNLKEKGFYFVYIPEGFFRGSVTNEATVIANREFKAGKLSFFDAILYWYAEYIYVWLEPLIEKITELLYG